MCVEGVRAPMTRIIALLLAGLPLAPLAVPLALAQSCTESGWGWETATCPASCGDDVRLLVVGTVDDEGAVNASFTCGGAEAICGDVDGHCSGSSPTRTTSAATGVCTADGYGGNGPVVWTHVSVTCTTEAAGGGGSCFTTCHPEWSALVAKVPESSAGHVVVGIIRVEIVGGQVLGAACSPAFGCVDVPAACTSFADRWSCGVGIV